MREREREREREKERERERKREREREETMSEGWRIVVRMVLQKSAYRRKQTNLKNTKRENLS